MKVLHVITSLRHGGAEKLVCDLMPRFREMGADCQLTVFDSIETPLMSELIKSGITVHRFSRPGTSVYAYGNYKKLKKLLSQGKYDIVHTHNTAPQIFGALCANPGTKLVTTEHNTSNRRRDWKWYRSVDKWMYSRYDSIISISQMTADNLVAHIGEKFTPKITVVSNGVDINCFKRTPRPMSKQGEIVVTMVAGFRDQKDQDTVVRAMSRMPRRYRLQLVGDGVRRATIEALVKSLSLDDRVDFLGERSDVPLILAQSDIIVLSSHYEGLSLSSIEAMASGRPLVASDVPGITDVVGGYGQLFAHGDDAALRAALLSLEDESVYMATAAACQERASQYDISVTAKAYMDIYHTLMGK